MALLKVGTSANLATHDGTLIVTDSGDSLASGMTHFLKATGNGGKKYILTCNKVTNDLVTATGDVIITDSGDTIKV